jgi:Glyoxalase-like domain
MRCPLPASTGRIVVKRGDLSSDRPRGWINIPRVLVLAVIASVAFAQTPSSDPLLGQGRGVDHVGVAVRDLTQAQHDYEILGFQTRLGGHFPGGLFNGAINFSNQSYLELLSVKKIEGTEGIGAGVAECLKAHEGAMFLGLNVSSAKISADYLRSQNFDVSGPDPGSIMKAGESKLPAPQWYTVGTADNPAPNKYSFTVPIFLIEYLSKDGGTRHAPRARCIPIPRLRFARCGLRYMM